MMKSYNLFWQIFGKLQVFLYTALARNRFGSWGTGSRLEPSAKLIEPSLIHIGINVYICEHAWLNAKDDRGDGTPTLTIGNGTYIGRFVHINAWQQVIIEDNVLISDGVYISDADHIFNNFTIPILFQGDYFKGPIRLKQGCWIGIGAVILPGVTVGSNSVVAANSVVTKEVPDFTVAAGNPAVVIKSLKI
jgi:acetyltransferase-like isoleucine patch superfamily enzyme